MAASWTDLRTRLGPARFRGAAFYVDRAALDAGRKTVTHEYPQRDTAFVEDLGRQARAFTIDGYVIGDDYLAQKERLLDAVEQPGPGTLDHPYYGTRRVAVTGFHLEESLSEGRMARVSIQFTETPPKVFAPGATVAPLAQIGASADAAHRLSDRQFLNTYTKVVIPAAFSLETLPTAVTALRGPAFVFQSLTTVLQGASRGLNGLVAPLLSGTQAVAGWKRGIDGLVADANTLVRSPFTLTTRFGDLVRSLVRLPLVPRLGVAALVRAYGFDPGTPRPSGTTATRALEQTRYDALQQYAQRTIVLESARLAAITAAETGFETHEDAVATREAILVQLDAQIALADDEAYPALVQVRADLVAAVPGEAHGLPHLLTVIPPVTVPALVLAYRLYGDLSREADLVTRNRIPHPGFVIGGRALQVLADA